MATATRKPATRKAAAPAAPAAPKMSDKLAAVMAVESEASDAVAIDASTSEGKLARLNAAKAEHAALKAWIASGETPPRPATPNLEAMQAEANGEKPRDKKASAAKPQAPAPTAEQGEKVLALRNDKHAATVAAAVGKLAGVRYDGRYVVVHQDAAQAVFDKLVAGVAGQGEFTTRLLVLGQLYVRHAFPKVTDDRTMLVARLVTRLNKEFRGKWSVQPAADATPDFVIDGTTYTTTKAAAAAAEVTATAA